MYNYKISTAVFAVISLSLLTVLLIERKKNLEAELSTCFIQQFSMDKSERILLDPHQGDWILPDKAGIALEKFKKRRGIFYNVKKRAYGHYFGIEMVRKFIERIDNYNSQLDSTNTNRIAGFRVYRSRNEYSIEGERYDDVFFLPARLNMKNFYDIDPDYPNKFNPEDFDYKDIRGDTLDLILNTSSPCPNNCAN